MPSGVYKDCQYICKEAVYSSKQVRVSQCPKGISRSFVLTLWGAIVLDLQAELMSVVREREIVRYKDIASTPLLIQDLGVIGTNS